MCLGLYSQLIPHNLGEIFPSAALDSGRPSWRLIFNSVSHPLCTLGFHNVVSEARVRHVCQPRRGENRPLLSYRPSKMSSLCSSRLRRSGWTLHSGWLFYSLHGHHRAARRVPEGPYRRRGESLSTAISLLFNLGGGAEREQALHFPLM